ADEAALRAVRHDHGVLHLLRFHQPEDLRAEILAPVRPADAAARDAARAQVHALDALRVDVDLEHRPRLGQLGNPLRSELEGAVRLRRAVAAELEEVCAQRAAYDADEGARDAILVERRGPLELGLERALVTIAFGRLLGVLPVRIERRV